MTQVQHNRLTRADLAALITISVGCLLSTGFLAHRKLLETDEIVTLSMARLPSLGAFWFAVTNGGDTLPPLGHLLTRLLIEIFGGGHVVYRLPAVLAFWWTCICLYLVVRQYAPLWCACLAAVLPISTPALGFAINARPYSLLLATSATSLLCWERARRGGKRVFWVIALGAALAAGVASHWYAVLTFIPICAGEAVRLRIRRRVDVPILLALISGLASLVAMLPVIAHARTFTTQMAVGGFPQWPQIWRVYSDLLAPVAPLLFVLVLVLAVFEGRMSASTSTYEQPMPLDLALTAAIAGWMAIPICGAAVAIVTGVFELRYLVHTVVGFSAALALACARLANQRRPITWLLISIIATVSLLQVRQLKAAITERSAITNQEGLFSIFGCDIFSGTARDPVVVLDVHSFTMLHEYGPPSLRQRLVYLTAYDAIADKMLVGLARTTAGWQVRRYDNFVQTTSAFFIYESQYAPMQIRTPLVTKLLGDGFDLSVTSCSDAHDRYPRPGQLYAVQKLGSRTVTTSMR